MGQCVASAPLTRRLAFADVMMNSETSCTPITASAKPHQPPLVAVASFKQAASPSAQWPRHEPQMKKELALKSAQDLTEPSTGADLETARAASGI
jgi:hypothetical protein